MTEALRAAPRLDKWGLCVCCQLEPQYCGGHPAMSDGTPYCEECGQALCECAELMDLAALEAEK